MAEDSKSKCRTAGNNVDSNDKTNSDTGIQTLPSLGEVSTSLPPAAEAADYNLQLHSHLLVIMCFLCGKLGIWLLSAEPELRSSHTVGKAKSYCGQEGQKSTNCPEAANKTK